MTEASKILVGTWNISSSPTDFFLTRKYADGQLSYPGAKIEPNAEESQALVEECWKAESKAVEIFKGQPRLPDIFGLQEVGAFSKEAASTPTNITFTAYQSGTYNRPFMAFLSSQEYESVGLTSSALALGQKQSEYDAVIAVSKKTFKNIQDLSFRLKTTQENAEIYPVDNKTGDMVIAAFSATHKETSEQVLGVNVHLPSVDYQNLIEDMTRNTPSNIAKETAILGNKIITSILPHLSSLCSKLSGRVTVILMGDFNATWQAPVMGERFSTLKSNGFDLIGWADETERHSHCRNKGEYERNIMRSPDFVFLNTEDNRGYLKRVFHLIKSLAFSAETTVTGNRNFKQPNIFPLPEGKKSKLPWDVTSNPSDHIPVFAEVIIEKQPSLLWRFLAKIGSWLGFKGKEKTS